MLEFLAELILHSTPAPGDLRPSDFASVFQLAVALNLVLSGYTEIRTNLETMIETKVETAKQKMREILHRDRMRVPPNSAVGEELLEAYEVNERLDRFGDEYHEFRRSFRQKDGLYVKGCVSSALVALASLVFVSTIGGQVFMPKAVLLAWSACIYVFAIGAIARALVDAHKLRTRFWRNSSRNSKFDNDGSENSQRDALTTISSRVSKLYNGCLIPLCQNPNWKRHKTEQNIQEPNREAPRRVSS